MEKWLEELKKIEPGKRDVGLLSMMTPEERKELLKGTGLMVSEVDLFIGKINIGYELRDSFGNKITYGIVKKVLLRGNAEILADSGGEKVVFPEGATCRIKEEIESLGCWDKKSFPFW
jgi:hypothetical protein